MQEIPHAPPTPTPPSSPSPSLQYVTMYLDSNGLVPLGCITAARLLGLGTGSWCHAYYMFQTYCSLVSSPLAGLGGGATAGGTRVLTYCSVVVQSGSRRGQEAGVLGRQGVMWSVDEAKGNVQQEEGLGEFQDKAAFLESKVPESGRKGKSGIPRYFH